MRLLRALFPTVLALQVCSGIFGQEVVSARSGMVHFTEGQVFLDGQPLDRKSGSFPSIKEGSTLRTEKGRAEILLIPGAFLRLDENSSIKMVSTELADTRLVFESGSAILDLTGGDLTDGAQANNGITITYKDARVKFPQKGVYRLDGDTGVLQVYSGGAEVTYAGQNTQVDPSHLYFCWLGLETNKLGNGTEDEFYDWASDRNQVIGDENQLAAETGYDPGDVDPDPGAQFGAGTVPYSGSPGVLPPSVGPQVYPAPYSTYAMGSTLFDPFSAFGPTPYIPFGFPKVVVVRPHRADRSQWPHSGTTWPHSGTTWPHSGTHPAWHPIANRTSSFSPTLPTKTVMPPRPLTVYRPAAAPHFRAMPRPSAPIAVHPAVGRR